MLARLILHVGRLAHNCQTVYLPQSRIFSCIPVLICDKVLSAQHCESSFCCCCSCKFCFLVCTPKTLCKLGTFWFLFRPFLSLFFFMWLDANRFCHLYVYRFKSLAFEGKEIIFTSGLIWWACVLMHVFKYQLRNVCRLFVDCELERWSRKTEMERWSRKVIRSTCSCIMFIMSVCQVTNACFSIKKKKKKTFNLTGLVFCFVLFFCSCCFFVFASWD